MVDSAQKSMLIAGVTADDITLIVPHQANTRIISAACDRLGIPKFIVADDGLALQSGGLAQPLRPALVFQSMDE